MLAANRIAWIPVMVSVEAFPLPLQIQLVGFASAVWMRVGLQAGARSQSKSLE